MVKFKNLIFLCVFSGILISSFLEFTSSVSSHYIIKEGDCNLKINGLDDSWNVELESFGLDMAIDLNNCIYIMASEHHHCLFGCVYYGDIIIIKYNQSGNQLWKINLEGLNVELSGIAVDSKSNLYLASMYENQTIVPNMILYKFNSSGNLKWQQKWGSGNGGYFRDIAIDSADNIYNYGDSGGLFIVKYNSSGDQQWMHTYDEDGRNYEGWAIDIDSDNNIIISGEYWWITNGRFNSYSWLRCYNQSGDLKWNITNNVGRFFRLEVNALDEPILVNRTSIVKFDNLGNLLWRYDHQIEFYWQVQIAFDSFNSIYAATSVNIPEDHGTFDLYLIKINSSGSFEWYLTWGGTGEDDLKAISIDSNDNIYLLSDNFLIKNPENNGKSLTNIKLWNFYMILFGICSAISVTSLFFLIKRKVR